MNVVLDIILITENLSFLNCIKFKAITRHFKTHSAVAKPQVSKIPPTLQLCNNFKPLLKNPRSCQLQSYFLTNNLQFFAFKNLSQSTGTPFNCSLLLKPLPVHWNTIQVLFEPVSYRLQS